MAVPYMIIGVLVLLVAVMFMFTRLPDIHEGEVGSHGEKGRFLELFKFKHFNFAILAQFLYVAAQTGINSFLSIMLQKQNPKYPTKKQRICSHWDLFFSCRDGSWGVYL